MARVQIRLPNAFIDSLDAASRVLETSADEVLQAGAAVVEPRMRANLTGAMDGPPSSPRVQPGNYSARLVRPR